jgi:peroxiredoxin family protein
VASLAETVAEARRELGLEVVACDTAVRLAGLDPSALSGIVDRVVGLLQLWLEARGGRLLVV